MDSFLIRRKNMAISLFTSALPRVTMTPAFYSPSLLQPPSLDTSVLPLPSPSPTLSLLCPISLARQEVPVRTRACSHIQTFDLRSAVQALSVHAFLSMKNFTRIALGRVETAASTPDVTAEFSCPVCRASGSLYVDRLLEEALDNLGNNVTEVVVTEEGKVVPGVRESIQVILIAVKWYLAPSCPVWTWILNKITKLCLLFIFIVVGLKLFCTPRLSFLCCLLVQI